MTDFYRISRPSAEKVPPAETGRIYRKLRLQTFIAATLGYSLYYVCRTGINVVKQPVIDSGFLTAAQLGTISSCLLFTYAIGKFVNGFLADYSNIRRFMATGLLVSAAANFLMGATGLWETASGTATAAMFIFLAILWGINGWAQSMGAPPSIVSLSRWFPLRERGTFYGFFSASHNFGEGLSFLFVGLLVALAGWQWGFFGAAAAGLIGAAIIIFFLHDTPESRGLPPIEELSGEKPSSSAQSGGRENTREIQKQVLANPTVWILALASAFMYISRYAVNGWGVLFLQEAKGFSLTEATGLISVNAWFGIIGTVFSGWLSDKVFRGDRNRPALIFGIMNTAALCLFLYGGDSWAVNVAAMVLFGTAIGVLICFLGGLMAVDIVPRKASGAALGIVGIMSYVAAGERKSSCGRQKYVLSFSERRLKLF